VRPRAAFVESTDDCGGGGPTVNFSVSLPAAPEGEKI
jgi:hypothetical protein